MSRQLDLIVQGSLGTNPVVSRTSSGRLFCYFRVATAPSFRIEDVWREGPTIWFTAKAWGYLAENLARSLHKGDPVVLVGRFSQDLWENDRGQQLTNVLTVSCGGPDLTWGESRFMRDRRRREHDDLGRIRALESFGGYRLRVGERRCGRRTAEDCPE